MPATTRVKQPGLDEECFFIAPIGAEDSDIRKRSDAVLNYIVARAASEFGLTTIRADKISDPGQITLQVLEHVLKAKAAVADLTGNNPNVFYEVAIRHTARLPLVLIAEKDSDLPFDIAQMRTVFFDHKDLSSAESCKVEIVEQLRAALEDGVVDSPIATSIDLISLSSGSVTDRSVAELITTVEELSKHQRQTRDMVSDLLHEGGRFGGRVPDGAVQDLVEGMAMLHELDLIEKLSPEHEHVLRSAIETLRRPVEFLADMYGLESFDRHVNSRKRSPSRARPETHRSATIEGKGD